MTQTTALSTRIAHLEALALPLPELETALEGQLKWPGEIAILWFIPVVDGALPVVWDNP